MQTIFETLIDSYIENKVGISENFIGTQLSNDLQSEMKQNFDAHLFHKAGIGNKENEQHQSAIRSDKIFWLDRCHNNKTENLFLDRMDGFINYLNQECYTGITHCEFHYAIYEKGTYYAKHLDQFQQNSDRAFSMIHYLNNDWQQNDGGELCIHHASHQQLITPTNGKSVFFKSSELPHEVLVTNEPRLSITGWLKTN
jgi:SM-20-related protein